jgi:hypothetical protein
MIPKELKNINENDLIDLKNNKVLESKTLDYKKTLSDLRVDPVKEEFLADISSFANSSGGDLVFGIEESRGEPITVDGFSISNVDNLINQIQSILNSQIEPRIFGIDIQPIQLINNDYVLIIRIPKSWNPPHRVVFKNSNKFFARGANGKYELDVGDLRILFNISQTLSEQIKKFKETRISQILSGETPINIDNKLPILLLHLIPLSSFILGKNYDLSKFERDINLLRPIKASGLNYRYNFDGFLSYSPITNNSFSYAQFFRNGVIESATSRAFYQKSIDYKNFEDDLINATKNYIKALKELNIEFPILVSISFLNVLDFKMSLQDHFGDSFEGKNQIEKNNLLFPEIILETGNENVEHELKVIFDSVWNSCGYKESINYKNGEFIQPT